MVQEIDSSAAQVEELSDRLIPFFEQLREDGFNIGVGEYLNIHRLLIKLSAMGMLNGDLSTIGGYLAPLVSGNENESKEFQEKFSLWSSQQQRLPQQPQPTKEKSQVSKDLSQKTKAGRPWIWWTAILILVIVVASLYIVIPFEFGVPAGVEKTPKDLEDEVTTVAIQPSFYIFTLATALSAALLIWTLWWRRAARMFLSARTADRKPLLKSLKVHKSQTALFRSMGFLKTSQAMRKRYDKDSKKLDINATIVQTVEKGGLFTPVQAVRQVAPEYLLLIDRSSFFDHQTQYVDALVDRLKENNVFYNRYYFYQDPRLCFAANEDEHPIELTQLAVRHPDHRLIVFSNGAGLVDRLTGTSLDWLDVFDSWINRTLMPFEARNNRQKIDVALSGTGFHVLPAGEKGLSAYIQQINSSHPFEIDGQNIGNLYPDLLRDNDTIWFGRITPDKYVLQKLDEQLLRFLGKSGYTWLASCAVYPQIHFDLTLLLGQEVKVDNKSPLFDETTLKSLCQLPWFRAGKMPDWLRAHLLEKMDVSQEKRIRMLLRSLLLTALEKHEEGFELTYAEVQKQDLSTFHRHIFRKLRKVKERNNPLHDYIFADFMENPLSISIPRRLAQTMRHVSGGVEATNPAFAATDELFEKPKFFTLLFFFILSVAGTLNSLIGSIYFNEETIPYALTMLTAFRYGPRIGFLGGALFFLPALLFNYTETVIVDMLGRVFLELGTYPEPQVFKLSLQEYLFHPVIGWGTATLKTTFATSRVKPRRTRWLYLLWVPIIFTSFIVYVSEAMTLYFEQIAILLFVLIAFHAGFRQVLVLLAGWFPITMFQVDLDMLQFGGLSGINFAVLTSILFILSNLEKTTNYKLGFRWVLYAALGIISLFFTFTFDVTEVISIEGYAVALAMIFVVGVLFGSRRGYRIGLMWGIISGFYVFKTTDILSFGGDELAITLMAPVVGYWAGRISFSRLLDTLPSVIQCFGAVFCFQLFIALLSGSTRMSAYLLLPLYALVSIFLVMVLLFVLQKFRVEQDGETGSVKISSGKEESLFKPANWINTTGLAVIGMAFTFFNLNLSDDFRIQFQIIQYAIVLLAGYYYGKRQAIVTGMLVFLPNLVMYYFGMNDESRSIFESKVNFYDISYVTSFSIISYALHGSLGVVVAEIKERLHNRGEITHSELLRRQSELKLPEVNWKVIGYVILVYVTCFNLRLTDLLGFNGNYLFYAIMMHLAFTRNFDIALKAIYLTIPLLLIAFNYESITIGQGMGGVTFTTLIVGLIVSNIFGLWSYRTGNVSKPRFIIFIILATISALHVTLSESIQIPSYVVPLAIVYLAGIFCGDWGGFYCGLIVAILTGLVEFNITDVLRWGGNDWSFVFVTLPIAGYLGGNQPWLDKSERLTKAVKVIIGVYIARLLIALLSGNTNLEMYWNVPIHWLITIIPVLMICLIAKTRLDSGQKPSNSINKDMRGGEENGFWERTLKKYDSCNGAKVKEMYLPETVNLVSIKRKEELLIPRGSTVLREGDILTIFGNLEEIEKLDLLNMCPES